MTRAQRMKLERLNAELAKVRKEALNLEIEIAQVEHAVRLTPGVRVHDILAAAAELADVSVEAITGVRGDKRVISARLAVYLIARWNGHTNSKIARLLGRRDHSTVVDGSQECRRRMEIDGAYRGYIMRVQKSAERRTPFTPAKPPLCAPAKPLPSPKPANVSAQNDDELDEIEQLSRAVAAHYAGAGA
jgi:hypothetical protein